MRVFWEKLGVLLPIYRLVGSGWNDQEVATRLGISEPDVNGCVTWLLRFLGLESRGELLQHACPVQARSLPALMRPSRGDSAR